MITLVDKDSSLQIRVNASQFPSESPLRRAIDEYDRQWSVFSFSECLSCHLERGVVWSSIQSFALVRAVRTDWRLARLLSPHYVAEDPDCWWVYLLAGDWKDALSHLPHFLPFIGWERRERPRFHRLEDLVRRANI